MFSERIDRALKGAKLAITAGTVFVAACNENPTVVSPRDTFDTAIELSASELAPGDSLSVTITVTNMTRSIQSLVFGCGYTIGIGLLSDNGEGIAWDQVCPTTMVELNLGPGESEIRKSGFRLTRFSAGHQQPLPPGRYVARGGLWGLAETHPWAEAEFWITGR